MAINKKKQPKQRCGTHMDPAVRYKSTQHVVLMGDEERRRHDAFCRQVVADLAPVGVIESQRAFRIARDLWRWVRLSAAQDTVPPHGPNALTDYINLLDRRIQDNVERLNKMQVMRRAERDKQLDKAAALAQLNFSKGHPYNPDYDFSPESGFTFSIDEIEARIARNTRLAEARQLERARARQAGKDQAQTDRPKAA
jgi:hypothetical protein